MKTKLTKLHVPLSVADDNGWPVILDSYGEYVAKAANKEEADYIVMVVNSHADKAEGRS